MGKINTIIVDDEVRAIDLFKGLLEEFNEIPRAVWDLYLHPRT